MMGMMGKSNFRRICWDFLRNERWSYHIKEREGWASRFFLYQAIWRMKLHEMEKSVRQAGLVKDPDLSFGKVNFAFSIWHPSRDAKEAQDIWVWNRDVWVGYKNLDDISTEMLFKTINLDSIACGWLEIEKEEEVGGLSVGGVQYSEGEKMGRKWGENRVCWENDWGRVFIRVGGKTGSLRAKERKFHREESEEMCVKCCWYFK